MVEYEVEVEDDFLVGGGYGYPQLSLCGYPLPNAVLDKDDDDDTWEAMSNWEKEEAIIDCLFTAFGETGWGSRQVSLISGDIP